METEVLEVNVREDIGKNKSKKIRSKGYIPSVVYGGKKESYAIELNLSNLNRLYRKSKYGRNSLIKLSVLNSKDAKKTNEELVISSSIDRHPISRKILHVDFLRIDEKKPVKIEVPVKLEGIAKGQKLGGVLIQNLKSLYIACLPTDIPEVFTIDISNLQIGETLRVSDLNLAEGSSALIDEYRVIAHIEAPRVEKVQSEDAAAEAPSETDKTANETPAEA